MFSKPLLWRCPGNDNEMQKLLVCFLNLWKIRVSVPITTMKRSYSKSENFGSVRLTTVLTEYDTKEICSYEQCAMDVETTCYILFNFNLLPIFNEKDNIFTQNSPFSLQLIKIRQKWNEKSLMSSFLLLLLRFTLNYVLRKEDPKTREKKNIFRWD